MPCYFPFLLLLSTSDFPLSTFPISQGWQFLTAIMLLLICVLMAATLTGIWVVWSYRFMGSLDSHLLVSHTWCTKMWLNELHILVWMCLPAVLLTFTVVQSCIYHHIQQLSFIIQSFFIIKCEYNIIAISCNTVESVKISQKLR